MFCVCGLQGVADPQWSYLPWLIATAIPSTVTDLILPAPPAASSPFSSGQICLLPLPVAHSIAGLFTAHCLLLECQGGFLRSQPPTGPRNSLSRTAIPCSNTCDRCNHFMIVLEIAFPFASANTFANIFFDSITSTAAAYRLLADEQLPTRKTSILSHHQYIVFPERCSCWRCLGYGGAGVEGWKWLKQEEGAEARRSSCPARPVNHRSTRHPSLRRQTIP